MSFGSRLKQRRKEMGLKQSELGQLLGITGSAIGNYENDFSSPKADILYKAFVVLRCDANFLFQDEMKKSPAPAEAEAGNGDATKDQLLKNYANLNQEGRKRLYEYSDDLVSSGKYTKNNQSEIFSDA